ncbi:MAG: K+/H+ antiporter subunit F [bacterium]|nr:K+/H+ antiporter subunit F [bacterium]
MLAVVTAITASGLAISLALCLWRLVIGPATVDRLLALDTMTINVIALLAVLSIHLRTDVYMGAILVLGLLGFVGTVAIAKALMRGRIIE